MGNNKLSQVASLTPRGSTKNSNHDKYALYRKEKDILKEEFKAFGRDINWNDVAIQGKLNEFARQIIDTVNTHLNQQDLVETVLPAETVEPGDTYVLHELSGVNVYEGTYGASVRMNRPQFTKYTATPNVKDVGLDLQLALIRTGKYSASELADYAAGVIRAWRNHLLFTTTLAGMSVYQSGGAYYQGNADSFATLDAAFAKMTDEEDVGMIIGRRKAIHVIANMSGWADPSKEEFKSIGQVGRYAGVPIIKVNSFTDPDYGTVSPMTTTDLWMFSTLPAGRVVFADRLRSSQETKLENETLKIYLRWDDAIGIWHTNRIVRMVTS